MSADALAVIAERGVCLHHKPWRSASYFEDQSIISDAGASFP